MEIILVLISVVVSTGIAWFMRYLDRDNNQMEKIRLFINKRQEQFEKYFDDYRKKMKEDGVELNERVSIADATIKRLEFEKEDFARVLADVQKDKAAAELVEKKVEGYGRAITELSEMTNSVEENLKRLKNESAVVSKLQGILQDNQENVEKISKRIPSLVKDFEKTSEAHLKGIAGKTLEKFDERLVEIRALVGELESGMKKALEQKDDVLKDLNSNVSKIYENA